jgi:hypothetical protein
VIDQPVSHERVELTGGLFDAVYVVLEVTYLGKSVCEAKGLPNVETLFDRGLEKGGISVQLAKFEVHGCRNGEK